MDSLVATDEWLLEGLRDAENMTTSGGETKAKGLGALTLIEGRHDVYLEVQPCRKKTDGTGNSRATAERGGSLTF